MSALLDHELLDLPLMLVCGGVPTPSGWVFFTPEGIAEIDFGEPNPERLLVLLDGRLSTRQILASLERDGLDIFKESLEHLVRLRIALPTTRLYETYYSHCEGWSDRLPSASQMAPTFDRTHVQFEPRHKLALEALRPLLEDRRSCRDFTSAPIGTDRLLPLLWAMYGRTHRAVSGRVGTIPSPGALYSLDILPITLRGGMGFDIGVYRWDAESGTLRSPAVARRPIEPERILTGLPDSLKALTPAALLVLIGRVPEVRRKYGTRALKFLHLEAGHCMQNAHLACVALRLGMVQVGGLDLSVIADIVGLTPDRLYIASALIGEPASA